MAWPTEKPVLVKDSDTLSLTPKIQRQSIIRAARVVSMLEAPMFTLIMPKLETTPVAPEEADSEVVVVDEAADSEVAEEAGAEVALTPQLPKTREQFKNSKENLPLLMTLTNFCCSIIFSSLISKHSSIIESCFRLYTTICSEFIILNLSLKILVSFFYRLELFSRCIFFV